MSENPFRDVSDANPYGSPYGPAEPANPLLVPAIFLLVLASGFLVLMVGSLPGHVARISDIDVSTSEGTGELAGSIVPMVVWTVLTIAIIAGSINMLRLKGYSGALTAAILAMIPLCSPCLVLGIPFGIWAIVLLRRPEVKSRFR